MERVGFEVFLEDHFSKGFEKLGNGLKEQVGEIQRMIGELFVLRELIDFGKESMEYAATIAEAQAQIQASLDSTGNAAKVNTEELSEWAKELDENSKFAKNAIENAQSVMLTFTSIVGETQKQAMQASADLATKMHMDLQQAAVQVGKALQDPVRGIMALRREGVNFSKSQQEVIKHLVETGQAAKAQQLILKELNTEFGGSAQASLDANPILAAEKALEELKESVGDFLNEGLRKLIPYIKVWTEDLKELGRFLISHKDIIEVVALALTTYYTVTKLVAVGEWILGAAIAARNVVMELAEAYQMAMAEGMGVLSAAQWALNVAMDANPIGLIIIGITALIVGIYEAYQHFESFRRILNTVWAAIKVFGKSVWDEIIAPLKVVYNVAMAAWDAIHGNFAEAKNDMKDAAKAILQPYKDVIDGVKDVKDAWNGDYADKSATIADKKLGNKNKLGAGISGNVGENTTTVSGPKSTVVNIDIKTLAEFNNKFMEAGDKATAKMFAQLTQAALSAADDFNIIGGV